MRAVRAAVSIRYIEHCTLHRMRRSLLSKVRQNGLRWFFLRLKREFRSPTVPALRAAMDTYLRARKRLLSLWTKTRNDDLLYAFYDLYTSPITFNLCEHLIDFEYEAKRRGKDGFVVVIVPSLNEDLLGWKEYDSIYDADSKRWRFHNVLIPLTSLSPMCKGIYVLPRREDAIELAKSRDAYPELYDGVNIRQTEGAAFYRKLDRPHLIEGFRASNQGMRYVREWRRENEVRSPIVTITLRESEFDTARNSNIEAWSQFAHYLRDSGYHPVVIPDTDKAFSENPRFAGISTFRECAWNIGLRMALYEFAFVNCFVPNGPGALAVFSSRVSYIYMNFLPVNSIVTTAESLEQGGLEIGSNYRFATPNQRVNWKPDTYENIVEEFTLFREHYTDLQSVAEIGKESGPRLIGQKSGLDKS